MVVTQHVKNISTLSESQNAQLERAMKVGDKHDETEEKAPAVEATVAIRDENGAVQDGDGALKMSKKPEEWQVHRTRSVSKR